MREACPGIWLANQLRRAAQSRLPDAVLFHVGGLTEDGLLVGYASALGGSSNDTRLRPGHFKVHVVAGDSWRGRGIGSELYQRVEQSARGHGALSIRTHNDSNNAPMLAVNQKLGYRPEPGYFTLTRRLRD